MQRVPAAGLQPHTCSHAAVISRVVSAVVCFGLLHTAYWFVCSRILILFIWFGCCIWFHGDFNLHPCSVIRLVNITRRSLIGCAPREARTAQLCGVRCCRDVAFSHITCELPLPRSVSRFCDLDSFVNESISQTSSVVTTFRQVGARQPRRRASFLPHRHAPSQPKNLTRCVAD